MIRMPVSTLDVSDHLVPRDFSFGLNWYLNQAVKLQLNYERTNFNRGITFGSAVRDHEDVFLSRFQVAF